jgi:alpha-D-ribose 1-methylphosphonate 5-phosphate C-P lyase
VLVEPSEARRKVMHGEGDYSRLLTKLYEDLVHFDEITISHRYPTRINGHYVIDPSPIPRYDVPQLHQSKALVLLGAGREKKIYAVPPYTRAEPLVFDDVPFRTEDFTNAQGKRHACVRCGAVDSFLDEIMPADGQDGAQKFWQCSDSDYCNQQLAQRKLLAEENA